MSALRYTGTLCIFDDGIAARQPPGWGLRQYQSGVESEERTAEERCPPLCAASEAAHASDIAINEARDRTKPWRRGDFMRDDIGDVSSRRRKLCDSIGALLYGRLGRRAREDFYTKDALALIMSV